MASSNFFLPLTGKEDTQRLDVKYRAFLESDDEDEDEHLCRKGGKGKVSEWTIDDKPTSSQWIRSPSKKDSNNTVNLRKKPLPRAARSVQAPKDSRVKNTKTRDISLSKGANNSLRENGEDEAEPSRKSILPDDHCNIDDSTDDSDIDCESSVISKNKSNKRGSVNVKEPENVSFLSEGFSAEDTEKPKFSVRPSAAKVDFQLSRDGEEPIVKVPACMNQYLRDYQRDGIKFLYHHYNQGKGAILGDDMGLGKTVQVIGFLSALLGKQGSHKDTIRALPRFIRELSDEMTDSPPRVATKPFLIVGPACVMMNWLEELNTWGYFTTGKFHGGDKEMCLADVKKDKLEVVVTTFETFRDNVDKLCEIEWEGVIVDEVHKMKEPKAQVSKALNQISTFRRFGLTGTALQNHMVDLWSILDWAQPGILGSLEKFNHKFTHAIEMGQRHDANKRDLALARKQKDKFAEIRKRIMLRRTKAIIADQLPSKEDSVVMCRLTDFQVSVYKAILNHPHTSLILQAEDPCDCGRKKLKASCCYKYTSSKVKVWSLVLSFMHLLLKAANHCALLIPDSSGKTSQWQAKLAQEVCREALKDFPQFVQQTKDAAFLTLSDPKYCGKMKILQGLLSVFSSSHDKVLVFSYSTRLLDIIEQYVISECYEYRRIDGKTSSQKRMEIVHQFNRDADIFLCLISTKAGGLGLNLTGANRVVIFDPNWNPSHDLQAQDRAYRIGQTRNVKVYRLVSAGTIEENIYLRQIYKQQLDEVAVATGNAKRYFHGIQGDKWSRGELFGVKNMFSLRTSDTCLTMDILKRNERLEKDLSGYDITRYIPPSVEVDSLTDNDDMNDSVDDSVEESKEEREEDDIFLQALFGKDRILKDVTQKSPTKAASDKMTASTSIQSDEESNKDDEDEDFFLPNLRRQSNHERKKYDSEEQQSSEKDLFTVDEITFPRSTCSTMKTQQKPENLIKVKSRLHDWKPSSGLSWLFSSDSDDDDNKQEEDENSVKEDGEERKCDSLHAEMGQRKTASMLSRLFPDSDDDVINENENSDMCHDREEVPKYRKKQQSQKCAVSKRSVKIGGKQADNEKPSTSGVRQIKARASKNKKVTIVDSKSDADSVKAVFEACGVLHIHGNKDVIGSSRAEDHMTRCAMQEVFEMKTNTQMPAMQCDPLPQNSEEKPKSKKRKGKKDPPDHNAPSSTKVGSVKILLGQTPPGVQRQIWGELCHFMKEDQLVLAQRIVTCAPEERLKVLRDFYKHKHPKLDGTLDTLMKVHSSDDLTTSIKERRPNEDTKSSDVVRERKPTPGKPTCEKTVATNLKQSRPTSSKSKRNIRRPLPSTLTGLTLLDSESQDSLTAHSPPTEPSLSPDDEGEKFSPVPPKPKPRRPSPSKLTATTRIRQKALNNASRVKLFKKPLDRKGVAYDNNDDLSDNKLSSVSIVDGNDTTVGSCMTQTTEDIPSLLWEMGGQASKQSRHKYSRNFIKVSVADSNRDPMTSNDTVTEAYDISSSAVKSIQTRAAHKSTNRQQNSRRDYASILDDIFDDKTIDMNVNESKEENRSELLISKTNEELSTEKLSSHTAKSDFFFNDNRPSTSSCKLRLVHSPRNSSVCEVEESVNIVEDSDDYSEVDGLFLTSTLKEDNPGSSRRRKGQTSPGKGKRRKKGFSPRKRMEMEVMDEADGHSQSLFS